jgi:CubicO group peptidase (beta-lactamase class C family)
MNTATSAAVNWRQTGLSHFLRALRQWWPILLLTMTASTTAAEVDARGPRIAALLRGLHERGVFNGAVIVAEKGRVLHEAGYGPANAAAGRNFTPDTPADGASLAKTFSAAAVVLLQEEGRLTLDDTVRRHLPEFPYAEVKIRHLLAHSNGLPDYDWLDQAAPKDSVRTNQVQLRLLAERRPELSMKPGHGFAYSNLGYDLLAMVIERVSGRTYAAFLDERFFRRLAMTSAFLRPARLADWSGVRTVGYKAGAAGLTPFDVFDNEGFHGGCNWYFSARDLHRWNQAFFPPAATLGEKPLRAGLVSATLDDGRRTGIGLLSWYSSPDGTRHWYSGDHQAFYSVAYRDAAAGRSIVFMTNNAMPQWLRPRLVAALGELLDGRESAACPAPEIREFKADGRAALAGAYAVEKLGLVALEMSAERAFCRVNDGVAYEMFLTAAGVHYVPGLDAWIWFDRAGEASLRWATVLGESRGLRQHAAP